ncbi:MAG: DUF3853 family protein [Bacteroidales bacterium]|nr:DUF3853 family protein [Bacteroidales bacterium]
MNEIVVITKDELAAFADDVASKVAKSFAPDVGTAAAHSEPQKRLVYGRKGIAALFGVSVVTAQKYKDTFLKPAVTQRGRTIITDADLALRLFEQRNNTPEI